MQDENIIKTHLGFRWVLYESNLQSNDLTFFLIDKFVLENLLPGDSCCLDDLPDFYSSVICNLTSIRLEKYQNIIAINPLAFSYKSLEDIQSIIANYILHLDKNGHLIISINFDNLIYDRTNIPIKLLINRWVENLKDLNLICIKSLYQPNRPFGYGDYFFVFRYE